MNLRAVILVGLLLTSCTESESTQSQTQASQPTRPARPPEPAKTDESAAPDTATDEKRLAEAERILREIRDRQAPESGPGDRSPASNKQASETYIVEWVFVDLANRLVHRPACSEVTSAMSEVRLDIMKSQGIPEHEVCRGLPTRKEERPVTDRTTITMSSNGRSSRPASSAYSSSASRTNGTNSSSGKQSNVTVVGGGAGSGVDKNLLRDANNFFDVERKIAEMCGRKWSGDADMAAYCYKQQLAAAQTLDRGRPFGANPDEFDQKRVHCYQRWGTDYEMRLHCEGH